jgi:glycosyltransferase involved in cell wall biosynthesis
MQGTKVLYIVTQSDWGGAQKYVYDLASNLPKGYIPVVVCGGNGKLIDRLERKGVLVIRARRLLRRIDPLYDVAAYFEIKRILRIIRPDIVHLNSTKAEVIGGLAARRERVPHIIFTAHGYVVNEQMPEWKKTIYVRLERYASKMMHRIICVSKLDRFTAFFYRMADFSKISVIHNGIGQFKISKRTGDKLTIVTVANMYPNKGYLTLLKAIRRLNREGLEARYIFAGDGKQRAEIEGYIARYNLKNIKLLGFRHSIKSVLALGDIFVLASYKEGLPFVVLEAMMAGLPVVATKVGGIPEIITEDDDGLLVPPARYKQLAKAIMKLACDRKLRRKIGRSARQKVIEQFSKRKMLDSTYGLYEAMLEKE